MKDENRTSAVCEGLFTFSLEDKKDGKDCDQKDARLVMLFINQLLRDQTPQFQWKSGVWEGWKRGSNQFSNLGSLTV